ncbi:MAG: tRNA (adenosine(37)-N6)-threonylcarbamoyltransferase complex ATPase subunit type 1 TsaE [Bacteroidia bacterium]|nr:tRNA (adenosine(37)-N6)-threonylcarbamoyltransferase complex ATPase subunit type 1 TsaE [Bacteroidia bacterium]
MPQKFTVCNEEALSSVSNYLKSEIESTGRTIVLLNGNLGAGKTTLVKNYLNENYGVTDVDSPTFSLVNDYKINGKSIHHFDLYRLIDIVEIEDIGFWDYVDSENICFIEWPDKIADILPEDQVIKVDIDLSLNQCREFSIHY